MSRAGLVARWLIVAVLAALVAAGCAAPEFTYVTNSAAHTYFKIPSAWNKIDKDALAAAFNNGSVPSSVWTVGYDASDSPAASDVFSAQTGNPFAFSLVEPLNKKTVDALSYNMLRDFFLPVTTAARQKAASAGFSLTGFKLLRDAMLVPGEGVHGIRETFDYTYPDGSTDTFDQVALTNADGTEVYVLLVHCLATCYSQHASEINTVMTSFTVRSH
jgi:hypothetical protein